jgi:hypothetical protein
MTSLLVTCGLQFQDWSASYRLFSRRRIDTAQLFGGVRQALLSELPVNEPLCVALDDSLLPKRGPKIHGVAWRRDPLGPPFQVNLIRAQRVLQFSAALTRSSDPSTLRMVPIDFAHAPTPPKPRKHAPEPVWEQYRKDCRQANLCRQAVLRWQQLEKSLQSPAGQPQRPLRLLVDGRFTNRQLLKSFSSGTTVIGRIRSDAKLYHPADNGSTGGRRKRYGDRAPTPEQLRQDDNTPWQTIEVFAAGARHRCRVKTLSPLLWRPAGYERPLRLVVIAPLSYRPRKGSRLLYRQPAFLICSDPELDLTQIVQNYIWRWDIGVSSQGHIVQSVRDRPRPKDSGLVAGEAPWRETKTAEPSDNMLGKECAQRTRLQRAVNAEVASLHESPVAETVDNARKQQELAETSPLRQLSPAGYQRRHGVKDDVETGEALGARRRKLVEEMPVITVSGKCGHRHQGGGSGRTTVDGRAAKRVRREGPGPVSIPLVKARQG